MGSVRSTTNMCGRLSSFMSAPHRMVSTAARLPSRVLSLTARENYRGSNTLARRMSIYHSRLLPSVPRLPKSYVTVREAKVLAYRKSSREKGKEPVKDEREVLQGRKKRRCALWVGYVGKDYVGSQIN
eukprot:9468357-Pyramimonas_sp.AAC.1